MAEEAKEEVKKEEKKEEVKEKKAPAKEAAAPAEGSKEKRKKINCMSLPEIESELKNVKEKMGGYGSRHAQELLLRKKELTTK